MHPVNKDKSQQNVCLDIKACRDVLCAAGRDLYQICKYVDISLDSKPLIW